MSELKGIFFNSGLQGIGLVKVEGDFFIVENLLQLMIKQTGPQEHVTSFGHLTPFVAESSIGTTAKIPLAGAFLYDIDPEIESAYYQSTSRIQPFSSIHLG